MRRRRFLAVVAAATAGGCAALSGDRAGEAPTRTPEPTPGTPTATSTPTPTPTRTAAPGTATPTPVHADYEATEVSVRTPDGERLGAVTAAVADTPDLRYLGLSDTDHLPADRGMLFVFGTAAERTFVMRGMDFGIDIVYADADGTITRVHHAPAPGPGEDGNEQRYPGYGRYVLEVDLGWTTDRGVGEGDVLAFEL